MKSYNYIYLITNTLNGKIYVGKHSTDNLDDGYMGSGVALHRAYNKYGIEHFTKKILAYADTEEKLNWFERFYIKKYHARTNGYNLTDGGDGVLGIQFSEETKRKISESCKGKPGPNKGKSMSEETKHKISETLKGKPSPNKGKILSDEAKQKISDKLKGKQTWMKGKTHSEESKQKMSESRKGKCVGEKNPFFGKHHSEETKQKISETLKGKPGTNKGKKFGPRSEETKRKISETLRRKKEAV